MSRNILPYQAGVSKIGTGSSQFAEVNGLAIKQNGQAVATLASPAFTGTPTAPTPSGADDSTKIATTAWVRDHVGTLGNLAALDTVGSAQIDTGAVGATQLASTGVSAGSYTYASITVDADGRITAASSGSAPSSYTDEMAQDAVGGIFANSDTITATYDDAGGTMTWSARLKSTGLTSGSQGQLSKDSSGAFAVLGTTATTCAAGNDARFPSTDEKAALGGTNGTPASGNKFVTDSDPRLPTTDENAALAGTSGSPSAANKFVTDVDTRVPTQDENDALAGTNGTPSTSNKYVTNSDPRIPTSDENAALVGTSGTPSAVNPFVTDSDPRLDPVTSSQNGLVPAHPNDATKVLLGTGVFGAVPSSASAFTSLSDTPASYSGEAGKRATVNAGETAVEFVDIGDLSDIGTPSGSDKIEVFDVSTGTTKSATIAAAISVTDDIAGLTELTAASLDPATDMLKIYDDSAGAVRKITPESLLDVSQLTALGGQPAAADLLRVYDTSAGTDKSVTYADLAGGTKRYFRLPLGEMGAETGSPTANVGSTTNSYQWGMDQTSDESFIGTVTLPEDCASGSTLKAKVYFRTTTAGTGNAVLGVNNGVAIAPGEAGLNTDPTAFNSTYENTVAVSAAHTSYVTSAITLENTGEPGERMVFEVWRNVDPTDSLGIELFVTDVIIEYDCAATAGW